MGYGGVLLSLDYYTAAVNLHLGSAQMLKPARAPAWLSILVREIDYKKNGGILPHIPGAQFCVRAAAATLLLVRLFFLEELRHVSEFLVAAVEQLRGA